jgi:hypothetical protein
MSAAAHILQTLRRIFVGTSGKNLCAHLLAIGLTAACVVSGLDWQYFVFVSTYVPQAFLFIADIAGFLVPIILPVALILFARYTKKMHAGKNAVGTGDVRNVGLHLGKAVVYAFCVSLFYKALSGRTSPPHHHGDGAQVGTLADTSADFHLGFMQGEMLGGWPSSHTTIACAMAAVVVASFPKRRIVHVAAYAYAAFIALGVSFGFHWLSEIVAGALIGTVVGREVMRGNK